MCALIAQHYKRVCVCGIVLSQCQCPSPDKAVETVSPCTHRPQKVGICVPCIRQTPHTLAECEERGHAEWRNWRSCEEITELAKKTINAAPTAEQEAGMLNFGIALAELKNGGRVCRTGWNGKGMWLELQVPDANSKMGVPYIYMKGVDGKLFPWNPNQLDMLSDDWMIIAR